MADKRYHMAVDTGGTFTDLVALDRRTGAVLSVKVPSTPADPARALLAALADTGLGEAQVAFFGHSTTVALNALLQRRGARTGLITTAGFRDVLEIGRFNRPEMYNLFYAKPTPLVARNLRREVAERVDSDGTVVTPLDEPALLSAAADLVAAGVQALAICFVNAYKNPEHEVRAAALAATHFETLEVTASHQYTREWREFERTSTTVLNAYLSTSSRKYLATVCAALAAGGYARPVFVTRSDGGLMTAASSAAQPVATLASGPAAGVQAAARFGDAAGHRNLITLDIGGTSCDVGLIRDGRPVITHEKQFDGHPVLGSFVDVHSIGAGGGTIAWIDDAGMLKLGPESAGADPGPACYGQGGANATVTDAYVVLGLLDPDRFLGGRMRLDGARAREAVSGLAERVGLTVERCALGMLLILEAQIVGALRVMSIERGYDPRDFALFPFGGAGGLHAAALARELGAPRVVVPITPALLSPWGTLTSDVRRSIGWTERRPFSPADVDWVRGRIAGLIREGAASLRADGVPIARQCFEASLDLRYAGQEHSVNVRCPPRPTNNDLQNVERSFHSLYHGLYGHDRAGQLVEIATIRVEAVGRAEHPGLARMPRGRRAATAVTERQAWIGERRLRVPVYNRDELARGQRLNGPAIIEEASSATVVHPDQSLRVDSYGMLVIEV
jgi:N-methylhydantoinase A